MPLQAQHFDEGSESLAITLASALDGAGMCLSGNDTSKGRVLLDETGRAAMATSMPFPVEIRPNGEAGASSPSTCCRGPASCDSRTNNETPAAKAIAIRLVWPRVAQ